MSSICKITLCRRVAACVSWSSTAKGHVVVGGVALFLAAGLWPNPVLASRPPPRIPTAAWTMPQLPQELRVEHRLDVDCSGGSSRWCQLHWSLRLHNPSQQAVSFAVPPSLLRGQAASGARIVMAPGSRRHLVVRAKVRLDVDPGSSAIFGWALSGRHLVLGPDKCSLSERRQLVFELVAQEDSSVQIRVRYPTSWSMPRRRDAVRKADHWIVESTQTNPIAGGVMFEFDAPGRSGGRSVAARTARSGRRRGRATQLRSWPWPFLHRQSSRRGRSGQRHVGSGTRPARASRHSPIYQSIADRGTADASGRAARRRCADRGGAIRRSGRHRLLRRWLCRTGSRRAGPSEHSVCSRIAVSGSALGTPRRTRSN